MNTELTYKLLKYLGQGVVIYLLFKYVPKEPMPTKDILLITTIVILAYAVFENLYALYYKDDKQLISPTQCNTQCAIKENFETKQSVEHMAGSISKPPTSIVEEEIIEEIVPVPVPISVPTQHKQEQVKVTEELQPLNILVSSKTGESVNVLAENLEKQRAFDLSQIDQSKMTNNGVYANPEITQKGVTRNPDGSFTMVPIKNPDTNTTKSRSTDDVMGSEMPYNYTDYNTLPIPTTWDSWENGSSFLPPAQWFPVPPHPPVCIQEKVCPVCPIFTEGTDIALKEWNQSRRISPPDDINVKYIQEKLNAGR